MEVKIFYHTRVLVRVWEIKLFFLSAVASALSRHENSQLKKNGVFMRKHSFNTSKLKFSTVFCTPGTLLSVLSLKQMR